MPLHLKIENETALPDGGPLSYTVGSRRGIDIGRDRYLDWVLPDPTRFVSGRHCEIRFQNGRYWLRDVSTNGTFVNRGEFRIPGPHPLRDGDRIEIGRYIIAVTVEPESGDPDADTPSSPAGRDESSLWQAGGDAAPPVASRDMRPPSLSPGPNSFDFMDWAMDIPALQPPPQPPASPVAAQADPDAWLTERAPQPPLSPPPEAPAMAPSEDGTFKRRFAQGAGLAADDIRCGNEGELAELLGRMMRIVTDNLRQLHMARAQAKSAMRSANQTLIGAVDNNPLRFLPTSEDALRVMFGPATKSYLDAGATLESSFSDLKQHQLQTFSALQTAIVELMDALDPANIEARLEKDKAAGGMLSSRKAKLWERYVTIWQAKTGKDEQGMAGVFMRLFAQAYDRS